MRWAAPSGAFICIWHPKSVCISNVEAETNSQPAANPSSCVWSRERERERERERDDDDDDDDDDENNFTLFYPRGHSFSPCSARSCHFFTLVSWGDCLKQCLSCSHLHVLFYYTTAVWLPFPSILCCTEKTTYYLYDSSKQPFASTILVQKSIGIFASFSQIWTIYELKINSMVSISLNIQNFCYS